MRELVRARFGDVIAKSIAGTPHDMQQQLRGQLRVVHASAGKDAAALLDQIDERMVAVNGARLLQTVH